MSANLAYMSEKSVKTGSREFVRGYSKFKAIATSGVKVTIRDRDGGEFIFMTAKAQQHPPRRSAKPLSPGDFERIDLDEPAHGVEEWEANR